MKRILLLVVGILLALVVTAPMVAAQSDNGGAPENIDGRSFDIPAKDPTAPPTDPASIGCSFPLHVEVTGKEKLIELPDGGFILTAPGQKATVTNVETGEEVTFNITGTTRASAPDENGIVDYVIRGRNLAGDPAGIFLNIGRFTYSLDQSDPDNIEIVKPQEGKGQAIDICALLS